jgi:hypothetical protein
MRKRLGSHKVAFNIQQQARDQANEEARRIPWQLCRKRRFITSIGKSFIFGRVL